MGWATVVSKRKDTNHLHSFSEQPSPTLTAQAWQPSWDNRRTVSILTQATIVHSVTTQLNFIHSTQLNFVSAYDFSSPIRAVGLATAFSVRFSHALR